MIKHSAMLKVVGTGEPFNCTYCKKSGEFTEFIGIRKNIEEKKEPVIVQHDKRKRRTATSFESLIPFIMQSGEVRDLYTRAIVIFNNQEVIL